MIETKRKRRGTLTIAIVLAITAGAAIARPPSTSAATVQAIIKPGPLTADYLQAPALKTVDSAGFDQVTTGTLGLIDIRDARGTGLGWSLVLAASDFVSRTDPTHTVSSATFNVAGAVPVERVAGNAPPQSFGGPVTPALKLFSAAPSTGMGHFQAEPPISLTVPADSFTGSYDSTITLTLTSGP